MRLSAETAVSRSSSLVETQLLIEVSGVVLIVFRTIRSQLQRKLPIGWTNPADSLLGIRVCRDADHHGKSGIRCENKVAGIRPLRIRSYCPQHPEIIAKDDGKGSSKAVMVVDQAAVTSRIGDLKLENIRERLSMARSSLNAKADFDNGPTVITTIPTILALT